MGRLWGPRTVNIPRAAKLAGPAESEPGGHGHKTTARFLRECVCEREREEERKRERARMAQPILIMKACGHHGSQLLDVLFGGGRPTLRKLGKRPYGHFRGVARFASHLGKSPGADDERDTCSSKGRGVVAAITTTSGGHNSPQTPRHRLLCESYRAELGALSSEWECGPTEQWWAGGGE